MRIVLAVDGSKYSRWATHWLPVVPLRDRPQITAVHVIDVAALRAPVLYQSRIAGNEPFIQAEVRRLEQQAKQVKRDTQEALTAAGRPGKVLVQKGAVPATILAHARRGDLIMLGHRGLSAMDRLLLGSVSSRVTVHAPCSVLVVKQPPRSVKRLMLATDGSRSSTKALRFLETLQPDGIEVTVLHVIPFLRHPELKEAGKRLVERSAERLAKMGYAVTAALKLGNPADEIIKEAKRREADLIVAGAKGLGAVARFFLGSVSMKLVQQSDLSTLIVR